MQRGLAFLERYCRLRVCHSADPGGCQLFQGAAAAGRAVQGSAHWRLQALRQDITFRLRSHTLAVGARVDAMEKRKELVEQSLFGGSGQYPRLRGRPQSVGSERATTRLTRTGRPSSCVFFCRSPPFLTGRTCLGRVFLGISCAERIGFR